MDTTPMPSLLSPKLDIVFKRLFVQEPSLLLDLLNQVLEHYDFPHAKTVQVLNPQPPWDEVFKKFVVLDIRASDDRDRHFDIEMQVQRFQSYPNRSLFYLARLYAQQLDPGVDYGRLEPALGVHFLDYSLYPDRSRYGHVFELRERHEPALRLTDHLALFLFEMPKVVPVSKHSEEAGLIPPLDQWLLFFNHAPTESEASMRDHYTHPPVRRAFEVLEQISADEDTRELARIREKALRDEQDLMNGARQEVRHTIAERMARGGMDSETIAELTGLSIDEVKHLQQQRR